jgi:hypothetical protein
VRLYFRVPVASDGDLVPPNGLIPNFTCPTSKGQHAFGELIEFRLSQRINWDCFPGSDVRGNRFEAKKKGFIRTAMRHQLNVSGTSFEARHSIDGQLKCSHLSAQH